jgi:transketolase
MATVTTGEPSSIECIARLKHIAGRLRRHMLTMTQGRGEGYLGQGLGIADVLAALYFHEMRYDAANPAWEDRDRFILSTGHYSIALWAALAELGVIPLEELSTYGADESRLPMSTMESTPGVEMTGGSLGHGLSQAVGMALGLRLANRNSRVFVELSDGELQEGSVWEAAMSAAHFRLDRLVAIVDCNGIQADGPIVLNMEPVDAKWAAFGWNAIEINGNEMSEIVDALHSARNTTDRPTAIIARTRPGKGISSIENGPKAHFVRIPDDGWDQAVRELARNDA